MSSFTLQSVREMRALGRFARVGLLGLTLVFAAGCSREAAGEAGGKSKEQGRYPLAGEVLRVEAERKVVVVRHDEIKGYMPAMTMEFAVGAGDLAVVKPGLKIRAEMVAVQEGDYRLEKIWPAERVAADAVAAGARTLAEDTHNRGKSAYREIGEKLPFFVLYDQAGRVVQSDRFAGKQILLNFIFSRCQVANMCPASTAKMMTAQRLAREAGVTNLELISITLDPEYDTPGVLSEYASTRGIDTVNFSFLTGPEKAIRDLLTQFGVIAQFQGDILQHTLTTLLIDANGRIAHRTDGSQWAPQEFVARMKR